MIMKMLLHVVVLALELAQLYLVQEIMPSNVKQNAAILMYTHTYTHQLLTSEDTCFALLLLFSAVSCVGKECLL
jgi:hypothetical protein